MRIHFCAEKVELGYRTNPHANCLERVFQRSTKQWIRRWPQRCQNCHRGCREATYSTGSAYSAKNDVEGLPYARKNPLQLSMDSREGSIVALSPKTRICQWRTGRLQSIFREAAHCRACHGGQCKVLKFQPFRSVLDPICGQCCFLSYTQMGTVQEVTDQCTLPILRRLNWNHFCS